MTNIDPARFPGASVETESEDLGLPTANLLRRLGMLPKENEVAGPTAAFTGPPDSVAVIETTALALTKWWTGGAGVALVAGWGTVKLWWPDQLPGIQTTAIWAAAIATAALVLGIAYIVGSDVRGRAAATVATLQARGQVAQAMIQESARLYKPPATTLPPAQLVPVSPEKVVKWRNPDDGSYEDNWRASAMRITDDAVQYHLTRGTVSKWAPSTEIDFG